MTMLRRYKIRCSGVAVSENWADAEPDQWQQRFTSVTHLVLLPGDTTLPSWAVFATGAAMGMSIPICGILQGQLDPVYQQITLVTVESIENYMLSERSIWEESNRVELARQRLHGKGNDPDVFYETLIAGDFHGAEDFLTVGMSPDARSSHGVPALVAAVRGGSVEITQRLLGAGADVNSSCGDGGESALCEAASRGEGTIVGVLLSNGASPNQRTQSGQTALMLAASQGHPDVVEHLKAAGADPDAKDSLGMTASQYAKLFGRDEIVSLLG